MNIIIIGEGVQSMVFLVFLPSSYMGEDVALRVDIDLFFFFGILQQRSRCGERKFQKFCSALS